jgi:hypothetical protein
VAPRNEISNERRRLRNVLVGLCFDDLDGGMGRHWKTSHEPRNHHTPIAATGVFNCLPG